MHDDNASNSTVSKWGLLMSRTRPSHESPQWQSFGASKGHVVLVSRNSFHRTVALNQRSVWDRWTSSGMTIVFSCSEAPALFHMLFHHSVLDVGWSTVWNERCHTIQPIPVVAFSKDWAEQVPQDERAEWKVPECPSCVQDGGCLWALSGKSNCS